MEMLLDTLTWAFVLGGVFFMVTGSIGVIRMPDVYCRLHSAGMTDTMGAGFILVGMCFQSGVSLITARLIIIWALLLVTSPVATHALARAALSGGVTPYRAPVTRSEGE
jgi:multicomponent Na+:H+ antiporter subunit G